MTGGVLPPINAKRVADYIVRRLRWYVREYAGKRAGVVGVSGGVDSGVTAALTVRALEPENTYCYVLPSFATPKEDVEDALELIRMLRVPDTNYEVIDIDPIVRIFEEKLGEMDKVERGNVMARVRMIIPHQRAYRNNALVIGTGDKSELLLGYFTKYGDGGVDVLPIGGLYKTHVRQLAVHLGLSEKIAEILGVDTGVVEMVIGRVKRSQHKRLMPEVFHVGFRDLGSDWRYPREWF